MDEIYGPHEYADRALMSPDNLILYQQYDHDNSFISSGENHQPRNTPALRFDESVAAAADHVGLNPRDGDGDDDDHQEGGAGECSSVIKSRIAAHPSYPKLIDAYIDCQKVGAAPEMVCLLDEIRLEKDSRRQHTLSICLGVDPELDDFMETYCEMLVKYKWDLSRPFDEATSFLNSIEAQLLHLCNDDDIALPWDEELSRGATQVRSVRIDDQKLKHKLFERYGKHINHLKQEFSKKKKKGKLPKEGKQIMLQWWNSHCDWPYPTEADKMALGESTGLDQKQINNWFINQRKRHWKSPENMQLAISGDPSTHYFAGKD